MCVHIFEALYLKLRAIVTGPIWPTSPLSKIVDIILKLFFLLFFIQERSTKICVTGEV